MEPDVGDVGAFFDFLSRRPFVQFKFSIFCQHGGRAFVSGTADSQRTLSTWSFCGKNGPNTADRAQPLRRAS
jgi:hypothetical protein